MWFHKKTQVSLNTKHCAQRKTEKMLKLAPKTKINEVTNISTSNTVKQHK